MSDSCTGTTAFYCPLHGTCSCERGPDGECDFDGHGCPLHGPESRHAENPGPDVDELLAENAKLRAELQKISDIRDDIIGRQAISWSRHIYPIVAALGRAGFEGKSYGEMRPKVEASAAVVRTGIERMRVLSDFSDGVTRTQLLQLADELEQAIFGPKEQ